MRDIVYYIQFHLYIAFLRSNVHRTTVPAAHMCRHLTVQPHHLLELATLHWAHGHSIRVYACTIYKISPRSQYSLFTAFPPRSWRTKYLTFCLPSRRPTLHDLTGQSFLPQPHYQTIAFPLNESLLATTTVAIPWPLHAQAALVTAFDYR